MVGTLTPPISWALGTETTLASHGSANSSRLLVDFRLNKTPWFHHDLRFDEVGRKTTRPNQKFILQQIIDPQQSSGLSEQS